MGLPLQSQFQLAPHTHLHQSVPFLCTSAPTPTQPARIHSSHSDTAVSPPGRVSPPHHHRGRGHPPEVCTAPWRPPERPESLGFPLAAGPLGSAGPAAAAAPHPPSGAGSAASGGQSGRAYLSLSHPAGPACYSAPKPACNWEGVQTRHGLQFPPQATGLSLVIINHIFINSNITTTIIKN